MKKITKGIALLLIALIGTCFFVACGGKEPVMKGVLAYEEIYSYGSAIPGRAESPYIFGAYLPTDMGVASELYGTTMYSLTYRPNLTVKSVKDLPKDKIVYTTEDRSGIKNGVVVNKWMYYYSLMVAKGERVDCTEEKYAAANEALANDTFTMEKASLNDECVYKATGFTQTEWNAWEGTFAEYKKQLPPYEEERIKSLEQVSASGKSFYENATADGVFVLHTNMYYQEDISPLEFALCYEYAVDRSQLKVAAMQRYGYIDINQMERGIGKLKVWYDTDAPQIGEKDMPILEEIPVIGYYESEADKLMSTGVPRDVQSEAYKLVFEQLYNPTFYLA